MANTPHRTIRVPDDLWDASLDGADAEGTNLSAVINEFLRQRYLPPPPHEPEPDEHPVEHCKVCGREVILGDEPEVWIHL